MANTQLTQTGAQVQADLNKIEGLPTPTVADSGKVVGVNSSGQYVLVNAGGGGGDTPPTTPTDAVIFYSKYPFSLKVYNGTKNWNGTLYYSYDHSIWDIWSGTTILDADLSDGYYKLYLRGTGNTKITGNVAASYRWSFIGEGIRCCGNLNNLLNYTSTPTLADYAFASLFYQCGNVSFDVTLPATTLSTYCYAYMFQGCSSLTTAPVLNATSLASYCYTYMFRDCISLTTAPSLPATTLAEGCYAYMFYGCSSLTTAPVLNAATLTTRCYENMFNLCISLTTAPSLPATTLGDYCYASMFYKCTSLRTASALPATTLTQYCYHYMYAYCPLTTPAKMAGGTTQATPAKYCCYYMYTECTSLNIYTSSSGRTAFYKAMTYSTSSSATNYYSTYRMFYNCKINGTTSTTNYLTAGTQYYY